MRPASRSAVLAASQAEIFQLVSDPEHLPRWWPGVQRVEGVTAERFTQVLRARRGRSIRADFRVLAVERPWRVLWAQELAGTPFARVLRESIVEVALAPEAGGTRVTLSWRQRLRGYSMTGGWMVRRATEARLAEALEGLRAITAP
ncbi:MAG TPA: SRPBCC family protein [Solirubrobacteraceae bacterium]|nr:SRPBCC family protein [Solirubrobacteraceae bacterium]